jgi:hypothetical protein
MAIAAAFLEELATVASLRKNLRNEPIRQALQDMAVKAPVLIKGNIASIKERPGIVLDLPETNARQGSVDCPSGMCGLDH